MSELPEPASGAPFSNLGLSEPVLAALRDVGYEPPPSIQAATIPLLIAGRDVLGQAQTGTGTGTGTGKTAAFSWPNKAEALHARAGGCIFGLTHAIRES